MKIIITESQYSRLNKSSERITNGIIKYMTEYISNGERKITKKSQNYGNLREDWCINGKETISAYYYFDGGKFQSGSLLISKKLIESLCNSLSIRRSYVIHIIEEWYDDVMVPKLEEIMGETGLSIDNVDVWEKDNDCRPGPVKPEGITDEEMIDFIVNHTLYTKEEVVDRIESGKEDLDDFYLHIVDTQNRKKLTGI